MDFEEARSFLSNKIEGESVYDHLSNIIRKILDEKPENALELFENISIQIKENCNENKNIDFNTISPNEQERIEMLDGLSKLLQFYGKKIPKIKVKSENDEDDDGGDEEEENEEENEAEPIDTTKFANILENLQILQWSGVAFTNKNESYQLQQSITKFIKTKGELIEKSRFFGKIKGIYNDYWILECKLTEYPEPPEDKPEKQEAAGNGSNEFVYFVTTNLSSVAWEQLPDATPEQIKQSRNVYRLFTGNLDNKVCGQTYFNGKERDLLRCQISRIVSSCTLSPLSYYNPPEEEDEENVLAIELNEEFEGIEEPTSLESWVHQRGHLRLEGRYIKFKSGDDEEEDGDGDGDDENKEVKQPTAEDLEEQMPILQPISNDKSKSLKVKFSLQNEKKIDGDEDAEEEENDDEDNEDESQNTSVWHIRELNKNNPYSIVNIQNKLWPGHYTLHIKNSKSFLNIYIGNGLKYQSNYYVPQAPSKIINQFNELIQEEENEEDNQDNDETQDVDNDENTAEKNNDENKDQIIKRKKSIFDVIQDEIPQPPPKNDENPEDGGDAEEEA